MEDVNPSGIREADPYLTAGAIRYAGGDWVVPADTDLFASYDGFAGPLGAFDATTSGSSLDVTIAGGEGFVGGSWLATDETTTVTLTAQTDTQRVYAGWNQGTTGDVLVGLDSAFGATDPKMPIWEFDTDGSGVTAARDLRPLGEQIDVRNEGSTAEADHATDADDLGGDVATAQLRAALAANGHDMTGVGDISAVFVRARNAGAGYRLRADQGGSIARIEPTLNGTDQTVDSIYYDGLWHIGQTASAEGNDIRNIGTFSATNGNVGGSPITTDADLSAHTANASAHHAKYDAAVSDVESYGATISATVSKSENLGDTASADLQEIRTVSVPTAKIDAGKRAEVPAYLGAGDTPVIGMTLVTDTYASPAGLSLQLLNPSRSYLQGKSEFENLSGTKNNPVITETSTRAIVSVYNNTGGTVNAGATLTFVRID